MNLRIFKSIVSVTLVLLILGLSSCYMQKKGRYENCSHFTSNKPPTRIQ